MRRIVNEKNNSIEFRATGSPDLVLRPGYFEYNGEKIVDTKKVYERFHAWLRSAESKDENSNEMTDSEILETIRTVDGISFTFEPLTVVRKKLQEYVDKGIFEKVVLTYSSTDDTLYVGLIYPGTGKLPVVMYFDSEGGHYQ